MDQMEMERMLGRKSSKEKTEEETKAETANIHCVECDNLFKPPCICTIRTSGKAKTYCVRCAEDVEKRLKHSGTAYIMTPYLSVHGKNANCP